MSADRRSNRVHQALRHFGELCSEKANKRHDHVGEHARDEVSVPRYLSWCGVRRHAQHSIALHLHEHDKHRQGDHRDEDPVKADEQLLRLKWVRCHGEEHEQHTAGQEHDQVLELRHHVTDEAGHAAGNEVFPVLEPELFVASLPLAVRR